MAEQRYEAVRAVIADGATVTEVASRFGVSRKTVPASAAVVLELRRINPDWGLRRLLKRHDQIDQNVRRRRDRKFKRWERGTAT